MKLLIPEVFKIANEQEQRRWQTVRERTMEERINNIDEMIPLDTTPDPELSPGHPDTCAGNVENVGNCCDECDYFLACFPEWQ